MITITNNIGSILDIHFNGQLVAVIGLSGGLTFLKSASFLSYPEIDAIEDKCREYFRNNK